MNLKEQEKLSLMALITQFFPETKGLKLTRRNQFKVLFILDGLDEYRLPLNFKDMRRGLMFHHQLLWMFS